MVIKGTQLDGVALVVGVRTTPTIIIITTVLSPRKITSQLTSKKSSPAVALANKPPSL